MSRTAKILITISFGLPTLIVCSCCAYTGWLHTFEVGAVMERHRSPVQPIDDALVRGEAPDAAQLEALAADPVARAFLIDVLRVRGCMELLPAAYATREAKAEADLARWLVYPTELDTPPAEMQLAARAYVGSAHTYYAFRFRAPAGHWASDRGWMFGISGPWPTDPSAPDPETEPEGTFSELDPFSDQAFRELVASRHTPESGEPITAADVRVEIVPLE